jgi:ATP-dependent helicase/nuclease subunit B
VRVRLLLGPAGSGKTFRCLAEARERLGVSAEGPPLLLVAPKQTTYQLERQLLSEPSISGYTRLHILSFERLAGFIFERVHARPPRMLNEEGRLMVLRGLLARKRDGLKLFRASARLTGFAQQLSLTLRELQRHQLTPESLRQLSQQMRGNEGLGYKLHDLAALLRDYLGWLEEHSLQDADCLLTSAAEVLGVQCPKSKVQSGECIINGPQPTVQSPEFTVQIGRLWVDGFAEFSEQEVDLLAAVLPTCEEATVTFCLDRVAGKKSSWLSPWSGVRRSFEKCRERFAAMPDTEVVVECLPRDEGRSRFANNPVLQHLEECWAEPRAYAGGKGREAACHGQESLRLATCADPEAEVVEAAREILRHVRAGGRYREVSVLVRKLEGYHQSIERVFLRYEIPFFLDRRESVSHHPLAELTRSSLRTVAFNWQSDDWFAALKTGLAPAAEEELDKLENEALARGWKGAAWQKPMVIPGDPELTAWLAGLLRRLLPSFQRLVLALKQAHDKPTGAQLAVALRGFWGELGVESKLQEWGQDASADPHLPGSVHGTVWEQMNGWLANLELAFSREALTLREWLPILEAGLANLTVGVIPPALDQVLVGELDRSRNPDVKLALVLGLNETVFPALPQGALLLTESDRLELERRNVMPGGSARHHLGRERYYAYLACTRGRQRVVLSCAAHNADGALLNPSPFLAHVRQLFPALEPEVVPRTLDWRRSEHVSELAGPLLRVYRSRFTVHSPQSKDGSPKSVAAEKHGVATGCGLLTPDESALLSLPALASLLEALQHFEQPEVKGSLSPELAVQLYGSVLHTSVSRLEQFAACPFKFFVHSGLRAEERKRFELDVREQGSFQHEVLALFHQQLQAEKKRWREITPSEARGRVAVIAQGLMAQYRQGLLQASEQTRFMARSLTASLQDFVATLVGWMQAQYEFEPAAVELGFGEEGAPGWGIDLGKGRRVELSGRIDRIDLFREPVADRALCVVLDYKSSQKKMDAVLLEHGLQLQLPAYLNVLRHWPNPREVFGVGQLVPAGVFYVNLRGRTERAQNRLEALDSEGVRKEAYCHTGRFDTRVLRHLDNRRGVTQGDQFKYRLNKNGKVSKNSREALAPSEFAALLDSVEKHLRKMGEQIYSGRTEVAPYRKGSLTACDQCGYSAICRIDPWSHRFRVLRKSKEELDA